jgi:hypothetical protein
MTRLTAAAREVAGNPATTEGQAMPMRVSPVIRTPWPQPDLCPQSVNFPFLARLPPGYPQG